jgi:serine/threonine-protein kinase
MEYRGDRNIRRIGNALRVSHVVEGSLRRDGQRLHLNAQLIDTRSDHHVWAEHYDVDLADVFSIQSEIARKIASELKSKVSTAEKKEIETAPTQDMEAYKLYLEAKTLTAYFVADNSAAFEKMIRAAELLEKAVARDPNFALAYCLLTETNLNLYFIPGRADFDRRARAESALEAAKRLAPDAGETHLAQARFYHYGNRDYDHALEELDIAARLLPNSADVFYFSALIERRLARWGDALRHFSKANELNPRDPSAMTQAIVTHRLLRHFTEVDQMADRAIAAFPEAADQFWSAKGAAALNRGEVEGGRAAAKHVSSDFQDLLYYVLYYGHNFAEAERLSLSVWQGKDIDYARYFAVMSAWAARAVGATDRMRSYFLSARKAYEPVLVGNVDPGILSAVGVIDAALGRNEDAIRECREAVELRPINQDALEGPEYAKNLALVYACAGDRDRAIEQLSAIVKVPAGVVFGELKLDPVWDSLRDDPRFEQLMAEAAKPIPLK